MRFKNLLLLSFGLFLFSGCAQQSQFLQFQKDVQRSLDRNEAAVDILKKDIFQLHSASEQAKQARGKREDGLKMRLANLSANFDELTLEIEAFNARIDEGQHFSQKSTREIQDLRKDFSSQTKRLQKKQAKIEKDLIALKNGAQSPASTASSSPSNRLAAVKKPEPAPKKPTVKASTNTPDSDLKKYKEAKFKFDEGDYREARKDFQDFLKAFPKSKLSDNAQFWLAECYYREGIYEKAIVEYEKVISIYPEAGKIPSALLKQAMAFQNLGDKESARFLYQKVIKEFPKASQAAKARYEFNRLR